MDEEDLKDDFEKEDSEDEEEKKWLKQCFTEKIKQQIPISVIKVS